MISEPIQPRESLLIKPLSEEDLYRMHASALEVLERVGVKIMHKAGLDLLKERGAAVDYGDEIVRIPSHLVEEALKSAPKQVSLRGRDKKNLLSLTGCRVHLSNQDAAFITDLEGNYREPGKKDTEDFVRLVDALENVHIANRPGARDIPEAFMDVYEFEAIVKNTTKPFFMDMYHGPETVRRLVEMSKITLEEDRMEDQHMFLSGACSSSPLVYDEFAAGTTIEMAKYGVPTFFAGQPDMGATGPVTVAGSLTLSVAELLAGVTLSQSVKKGTPNLFMGFAYGMDMRTGQAATGSPEHNLFTAATAQISRHYGLPSIVIANTDAYLPDAQAGYEKALALMTSILSGANMVFGIGAMGPSLSFEAAVIDNEVASMVKRMAEGIEVTDETIAVDLIKKVGPGGHYLTDPHTRSHFRKELFISGISNKKSHGAWMKEGGRRVDEKARELAKQLIATHKPKPLERDILVALRRYIERLEKNMRQVTKD